MSARRFARIDAAGTVRQVIVAESLDWCQKNIPGVWIETFKNRSHRMNYASVGFRYDEQRDAFIPPKPYPSWVLVEETCLWEPPIPYPDDGKQYVWDEVAGDWMQVVEG